MRTPSSTYRLQIRPDLTLTQAAALTDYLADLGVDAVYLSPVLRATTGSTHGYDVTDPTVIDPELGGEDGWRTFVEGCRAAGLQIVVDIVPNHLGISKPHENPAWWSVLREGRDSAYATWFDINWDRAPILVPVLGDDVESVTIRDGEVRYHEQRFPLAPGTYTEGDSVEAVLGRQHYRLAHWTTTDTDLNYRRFFTISSLIGVRVEDADVFDQTHIRVRQWVADGDIDGLRIDHPDGLSDPATYLQRLRELAPDSWLLIEKILEPGETLPSSWPIAGTTGYDVMTEINQVFIDPEGEAAFTTFQRDIVGQEATAAEQARAGKIEMASGPLTPERERLVGLLAGSADSAPLAPQLVRQSLISIAAEMPVYRTYVPGVQAPLAEASARVRTQQPELAPTLDALLPLLADPTLEVARRFEQFTGAVMAKGAEDTAYYRDSRFIALNEVGGAPGRFGLPPAEFHAAMVRRQQAQPKSMTALSTHDTKRGEDVRAQLAVLSETGPGPWMRDFVENSGIPDRPLASLLAQTFLGAGLIAPDRMHAYAEKAMREAKTNTTWEQPDPAFEDLVHAAIDRVYEAGADHAALPELLAELRPHAWSNSLAQKLVQLTLPGVPDIYQGTELPDDSLVDPDNRRPVDWGVRRALLDLPGPPPVGAPEAKFWLVRRALRLRREHPELFTSYTAVPAEGTAAEHLLAFDRGGAVTAVTRLPWQLTTWGDTILNLPGTWRDVLTDSVHVGPIQASALFERWPTALLIGEPSE